MTITAKNVRVRLTMPSGVRCRYVYGVPAPQFTARTVEYVLTDIELGSAISNLTEWEFDRHVPGVYRFARTDVAYDDAVSGRTETLGTDAVVEFVTDRDRVEAGRDPIVQRELEVHLASRNLEKTMMGMRTQQLTTMGALQEMQRTQALLVKAGRDDEAQGLTQAMDQLQHGGDVEKTLIGTIYGLDKGKTKG